ncbi:MAG: CinA family nicotinamide mononucleotide deamidase-related protein [Spirochaetes bacterium]|nr:CinA family nicotinamide mononucleotide deamidase-related protein [Spirochaetota bacterium]
MKTVTVLSTGSELLYGRTADTNSRFISGRIFPLLMRVRMHMAVGDDIEDLEGAMRHALEISDILIVTGGLGPTDDDNTIAALGKIFGFQVVVDGASRERMQAFFDAMGMIMSDRDLKIAEVPAGARVLPNTNGLAPGFIMRAGGRIIIAMPGVPREMREMMDLSVLPFLRDECGIPLRKSAVFRVVGMKESEINETIVTMGVPLETVDWGITAGEGIATVTIAGKKVDLADPDGIVSGARRAFGGRFLEHPYERPEDEVMHLLRSRRMTVSFAESCTGGMISKRLTDVPGSSDVFVGGVVAYSNRVKVSHLNVSEESLSMAGAVSEEVASEMAAGIRTALGSDIGVSTTGIAGPGGGTDEKPVGTVWFGLADLSGVRTFSRRISGDRERVRAFASLAAIEYLRAYLRELK